MPQQYSPLASRLPAKETLLPDPVVRPTLRARNHPLPELGSTIVLFPQLACPRDDRQFLARRVPDQATRNRSGSVIIRDATPGQLVTMNQTSPRQFTADESTPPVIVAALRHWMPDQSWSKIRKLLRARKVSVGGTLCMDESRKLKPGESVEVHVESLRQPPKAAAVTVYYVDRDIVVVDKPPRMVTLRHKAERNWVRSRKARQPALEEVIPDLIYSEDRTDRPRVLSVHRIDRDTSGLLVFARHDRPKLALVEQFAAHDVVRVYRAVVIGKPAHQTVRCHLVRDRGDGLRGSTRKENAGKESVTHIRPQRTFTGVDGNEYTEIECQLETGRTHQIRIHLAELGHPVCGDTMYRSGYQQPPIPDTSGAPRLALHARELGFTHPTNGEPMHFSSPWPKDLSRFLAKLEGKEQPQQPDVAEVSE